MFRVELSCIFVNYFDKIKKSNSLGSEFLNAVRNVCFPQVPQDPCCQRPPRLLKAHFHLSLIYLCDFTDWKKITWGKLGYLQSFSPVPVDDYWQVLGPCREGWTNAFLQMTVRQGKIEFSLLSICVCGGGKRVSLPEIGSDRWGTWKKTATPALQPGWIRKLSAN